jgi:hypothetical protein
MHSGLVPSGDEGTPNHKSEAPRHCILVVGIEAAQGGSLFCCTLSAKRHGTLTVPKETKQGRTGPAEGAMV